MITDARAAIIAVAYLISAILFIFGLKRLSSPATARHGNRLAILAMTIAVAVTLLDRSITWKPINIAIIVVGTAIGAVVGVYFARTVQMTAMPQMVALFNGMGGGTAAFVSVAEFLRFSEEGSIGAGEALSVSAGTAIGALSLTGSLIAFGKLQELISGRPIRFPGLSALNVILFVAILALGTVVVGFDGGNLFVWLLLAVAMVLGVLVVLPIGGADMPVVIALLNSFTGIAAALTGFVVHNQILIVAGALVGASGGFLTVLMSRAMNRPLSNVLFGAFGAASTAGAKVGEEKPIRETTPEDAAVVMAYANEVIIVPGYGLAVAQAQHQIRELADELEKRGVTVKYAIHPVAGRMPGHMNVLLAEANVPYDQLFEMDQINNEFAHADVALVVGANDVVNPAARTDPSSPIYGMPILNVDQARTIIVLKRSMRPGFAGIENELFHDPKTVMLFGDAKESLTKLTNAVKAA
ncbi:NAD(P)(+) transhydrogenase (Re/Si-specific) subunit beta [Sphaerobacter thermophilus]|uniref:NAD(P) transhydrogenase subunit beta n=1 Tax=Sphaerobacter thermophilus (strain ATCC 49802 / DSM 20745 / KCCM 41009 / NCIMB 13125 / S 6022) TaxID=479434 RepID=D1C562_SPHTD|nr:NAD(P)(+) transhydrogenase (Re/Si-specific) subunit beta [Sphaerobacter thermophilus]ACZ39379.1 NAD(P)(+) transhydrogenase (AB-specific) [Sphaerobacter thermophilus DSM 20745]PZN67506.1 MAG: NAD(P)(+) transhydrogenase (Re/Si-specific) subunit beta [Sphaerobacter thermophilus]